MDLEDATTLLWTQQLKREHKYLLQKIQLLESKQTQKSPAFETGIEERLSSLEQSLTSVLESTQTQFTQLKEDQTRMRSQFDEFHTNLPDSLQEGFAQRMQESGLLLRVTEIHRKLESLNAEIEDDALTLTSAVKTLQNVQHETEGLVERIFSLDHWVARLKTEISDNCNTKLVNTKEFEQVARKLDSLIEAKEEGLRKFEELENAIFYLKLKLPHTQINTAAGDNSVRPDETQYNNRPSISQQSQIETNEMKTTSNVASGSPLLVAETALIGSSQYRNLENSPGTGHEERTVTLPSQLRLLTCTPTADRMSDSFQQIGQASSRSYEQVESNLESFRAIHSSASPQLKESGDTLRKSPQGNDKKQLHEISSEALSVVQQDEPGTKRLRKILPDMPPVDEKFQLPVTLPGRQTRSRTRAAASTDGGHIIQKQKVAQASLDVIDNGKPETLAPVSKNKNSERRAPQTRSR